ncbi:HAD family hydrolase [Bacillus kwashiorkori]|uniref:HAD family hydrolase n=1 Tax=Bacillus kwashiorkori TaxID=1522318 RepID=UPI000782E316|nr:HAD family phosphatase [Bacillus kwashiorkori]
MTNINDTRLVIFDMDGLLFDTERSYYETMRRLARKVDVDYTLADYIQTIGITTEDTVKMLTDAYGEGFAKVLDGFLDEYYQILDEEGLRIKPGAIELLDVLDQKGMKKCIASSNDREAILKFLQMSDLEGRFDFCISGTDVERGKPFPDIFLQACRLAGVKPEEAIVLEDSLNGLRAAVAAEIPCIVVPDLIEPNEEMKQMAYRICNDLGEVAELLK